MKLFTPDHFAVATIWQEARGEPFEGKVAVGEVIRTRMRLKHFSDGTIEGTCLRDRQFSGWNSQDPNRIPSLRLDDEDPVVNSCWKAWLASSLTNTTKGATHYVNLDIVTPPWYNKEQVTVVIGSHTFLRLKG